MRLAAYLRVSTDKQADSGLGLHVQEEAVRAWARSHRHRIVLCARDEGQSGSNGVEARIGLVDALRALRDGRASGIVVYRLDRFARDLVLQEQLLSEVWRMGGRVFSTSPSEDAYLEPDGAEVDPSRALIRQILGAVAQYERAMIRLRLRSGKLHKAEQGGYAGGAPRFGVRAEGRELVPDPVEQAVAERAAELRRAGLSLRSIAAALEGEGLRAKRSERWHPETVRQMLRQGIATNPPSLA